MKAQKRNSASKEAERKRAQWKGHVSFGPGRSVNAKYTNTVPEENETQLQIRGFCSHPTPKKIGGSWLTC